MRKLCKYLIIMLTVLSCSFNLIAWIPPVNVATNSDEKNAAIQWLATYLTEKEQKPESENYNDLCNAVAVLRMEETECNTSSITEQAETIYTKNHDEAAHLAWACNDAEILKKTIACQNTDGGFGLQKGYTSDVYDTMLILMADYYCQSMSTDEPYTPICDREDAVNYLLSQQNADGGFGYHGMDISRPGLSAEIGLLLLAMKIDAKDTYNALDLFCTNNFTADFSEETFYVQAELARYLYERTLITDTESVEDSLKEMPAGDGSIFQSISDTTQYILLLRAIEKYHMLNITVHTFETEADTYILEHGKETAVNLTTTIAYTSNQAAEGFVRYSLLEDEQEVLSQDIPFCYEQGKNEIQITGSIAYTAEKEKTYILKTEVYVTDGDETSGVLAACQFTFGVHQSEETELILKQETKQDNVTLTWTDISNEDERFNYRLYRKCGDGEWESRSTWDGEETVKVLNIYPAPDAAEFLITWMEEPLEAEGEPAGKGLFEIDTVYIDDYNISPETYLMDEDGNYKYDVLMFGAYDYNNQKDLSYQSYLATLAFAETGRGILFGHDTVTSLFGRYYFTKFAHMMGMKLLQNGSMAEATIVKVINKGIITSYPWNLSGELTIPYTHALDQYAGGSLGSTIWMEFASSYNTDPTTKAVNNAYLFTKGALAMIQTGHTTGSATDDERKVFANTLFYLKQLTSSTKATDYALQDTTAPDMAEISDLTNDCMITLSSKDAGTDYQYYVEAIGTSTKKNSNTVNATVTSGLKGFAIFVNDNEASAKDLLTFDADGVLTTELLIAENGKAEYNLDNYLGEDSVYVHVFAIDGAGNISEEQIKEVTVSKVGKEYLETPYALFASDGNITINGNEVSVEGDLYGKEAVTFQGTIFNLDGKASSAGSISSAGWKINIPKQEENIDPVVLPDYQDSILADMAAENETIDETQIYDNQPITIPTICQKTTGAWCNDAKLLANLVSEGNVSLNANTVTCGAEENVILCSQTGDITIQATKLTGNGLIYAPNGTVTIHVSECNYSGTIIAKEIHIQASYYTQTKISLSDR